MTDRHIVEASRRALARTKEMIDRVGGRLAGSEACEQCARLLQADLAAQCGSAALEPFFAHPAAFTHFYRIDAILYLAGLALMLLGQPLVAGVVMLFMVLGASLQFGWYGVCATTMIAMPAGVIRDGLAYHTMRDTVDAIEPAAVEAYLMVASRLAGEMDAEIDLA